MSSDGRVIAFASTEDLVGENADRNSEIFLFVGERLKQLTHTEPASGASRLSDGSFQPSLTGDGRATLEHERRQREGWLAQALEEKLSAEERRVIEEAVEILRRLSEG